jgi:hypothetical protein
VGRPERGTTIAAVLHERDLVETMRAAGLTDEDLQAVRSRLTNC